jgi:hypothetical protein
MKNQWSDPQIEKALRGLRDETPETVFWETRVWAGIESHLDKPWYARRGFVRWAVAAVFLAAVTGVWQYQNRAADDELGVDLAELVTSSDSGLNDPETGVARDVLQGSLQDTVDSDDLSEPVLVMEDVYEAI